MVSESKTIHPRSIGARKTLLILSEIEKKKRCVHCKYRNFKNGYCDIEKEKVKKEDYCYRFKVR